MTINGMASAFQGGVADLAGTAVVVGMAKGILLVLGGSDADVGIHTEHHPVCYRYCA